MRLCKVEDLKENDILARTVMTSDFTVLLSEGAKLKNQYIDKLKELNIREVYIEEIEEEFQPVIILKEELQNSIKEKVKDILEKHTYRHNADLKELSETADNIITGIMEEEKVTERMFDIKARSTNVYEHSINTCALVILTALKMNLSQEQVHDIGVGCLLHDIGLRYLTIKYCDKNVDELADVQSSEYKKHPVYGYTALQREEWLSDVSKNIILYHHENMEGSGYPLHATEIPLECRIVSVCDTFDELICGIGCKQVKVHEAIEYLKAFQKTRFDDTIVSVFLDFVAAYPVGSLVLTNEGETGIVIAQNKDFPNRPILKITKDKFGNTVEEPMVKDLLANQSIFIEEVMD